MARGNEQMINAMHLVQWALRFVQGQRGSVASAEGEFTIPTKAGMMRFYVSTPSKFKSGDGGAVIYCRFERPGMTCEFLGRHISPLVNLHSGKWNHYFDASCSAEKIAIDFEHAFLPVALHPEKLETVGFHKDSPEVVALDEKLHYTELVSIVRDLVKWGDLERDAQEVTLNPLWDVVERAQKVIEAIDRERKAK